MVSSIPPEPVHGSDDGADGIRTHDPLVAKRIEHKLSYDNK
jgi:hypothetical protein